MRPRRLILILLVLALLSGPPAPAAARTPLPGDPARTAPLALPPRPADHSRLDSALQRLAAAHRAAPADVRAAAVASVAGAEGLRLDDGRVQAQIAVDPARADDVSAAVAAVGGTVTGAIGGGALLQAWLPVAALERLADRGGVAQVRRPAVVQWYAPLAVGSATTEALAALNAGAWHAAGFTGEGVRIGIIDGGFSGYVALLGNDLPAVITAANFVDGETLADVDGTTPHGTACAEIVHDVAPGAALYLAKIATNVDLAEAVAWLRDTHAVDVISTSLGWFNLTPGDGTGELADLVAAARIAGVFWVTAAGNARQQHWGGPFRDEDGDDLHEFAVGQNWNQFGAGDGSYFAIPPGETIRAYLRWDDWGAPTEDLDLHLLRWNGSGWDVVASSTDPQTGVWGQRPVETLAATTSGAETFYALAVERIAGTRAVNLELFAYADWRLDRVLHARSVANLADVPGALTVAALDVAAPYAQEPYSSEGPTNGPGGTAEGGALKPDLAAYAGVSTASYGAGGYSGTSAAAPHAAGATALVLSVHPGYGPDQLRYTLESLARDLGDPGLDTQHGQGRLFLGDPLQELPTPTPSPGPTLTPSPTATPTPGPYEWRRAGLAGHDVRDLAFHPVDAASAGASTAGSDLGVMVTHDGGLTWTQANHGLGDWEVLRLARGPGLPWTLYAASVNALWCSTDGAQHWEAAALPASPVSRLSGLGASPLAPGRVYVTAWEPCRVTYVSLTAGEAWHEYQGPEVCSDLPLDSVVAPSRRSPAVVYLARAHDRPEVYRSNNGGQTWLRLSDIGTGFGVRALAIDPRDDDHVYAGTWGGGVFETRDGGATWLARNLGFPAMGKGVDVTALFADPARVGVAYAALAGYGVYRTVNGGDWWQPYAAGMDTALTVHRLDAPPSRPARLGAATSDGVWTRLAPTTTWVPLLLRP